MIAIAENAACNTLLGKRRKLVRRIEDDSDEEFTPSAKDKEKVDEDDAVFDDISDTELMEIERDYTATKNKTAMTPIAERFEVMLLKSKKYVCFTHLCFKHRESLFPHHQDQPPVLCFHLVAISLRSLCNQNNK